MLTEEQIQFLDEVCPNFWTEENGVININDYINMCNLNLTQIPVQFGKIQDSFYCDQNKLTNLKHAPSIVGGKFNCAYNKLTSLEGGPSVINGYIACEYNQLPNLIGAPVVCNDDFYCDQNRLTSLEGCPRQIKGNLYSLGNPDLHILYRLGHVDGSVYYEHVNDLNEWIIEQARKDIFVTYEDISRWIKDNNRFEFLLHAQPEIRQHFSPRILHLVDMGSYNESRILDYKKFKKLC